MLEDSFVLIGLKKKDAETANYRFWHGFGTSRFWHLSTSIGEIPKATLLKQPSHSPLSGMLSRILVVS